MAETEPTVVAGQVVTFGPNLACIIRLDSGDHVDARIPKRTANFMFRIVPGDRVWLRLGGRGKYVVLGHERILAALSAAADDGA